MENLSSRESFWKDKTCMADFLTEPLNQQLYDVYMTARCTMVSQNFRTLKLFNEAYYICARIVLEDNERADLGDYIMMVKADMGWDYPSSLVVDMVYSILSLRRGNSKAVEAFLEQIRQHYRMDVYDSPFSRFVKDNLRRGNSYDVVFKRWSKRESRKKEFSFVAERTRLIIQVQQAEINLYSTGNIIGEKIYYESQRKRQRRL